MAVQRYVTMHFSDDWNTYLYFAQWGDSQIAANPKTIVRLEDWLLVAEEDGGGRIKGEGILQSPRPLTETNDGDMIGLSPTQRFGNKRTPTTPQPQLNLRTTFPLVARACSQKERDRDEIMDEELAQQEKEEIAAATRSQARREKYAAAANLKVNGPQGLTDNRKSEESDAKMEEIDDTPVPTARRGSRHRKNLIKSKQLQLKENEDPPMASPLRQSVDLHTEIKEAVLTPIRATALFPNTSNLTMATVRFTPSLDLPPTGTRPGVNSDIPSDNLALPLIPAHHGSSALHPTRYSSLPHNPVPPNETDPIPDRTMFSMAHRARQGSTGVTWFLQLGIDFNDEHDSKTTMLLGLSATMEILKDTIDGFTLHPLDDTSLLPPLTSNDVKDGFPGTAVLAFKYFLVRDKRNRVPQHAATPPLPIAPSPFRFNDEEDYRAPKQMWGVIRVSGNGNIKEACEALSWDMNGSGLQIRWKEHQSAESSAQVLLMNVPPVLDRGGVEEEIIWHLTQIENSLLKEGKLAMEFVGVPLPEMKVSWRQSKQGKGRTKEERALSLNLLGTTYQQNGCPVCTVEVAEGSWKRLGPLWEIFHTGLSRRALGRKCLMVVMYNGKETNNDRVTMQRLRRVNVIYMDSLAHLVIPNVACIHKRVEVQMEDSSTPRHKFTDLSREFMFLSITNEEGKEIPMFDVIMPYVNGMLSGSAVVTYRHDNIEAAILIKKI